jgi:hypothetical protein
MFTSRLPNDADYRVIFSEYAGRYFIKRFAKSYRGKQWVLTQDSIFQQLKRIHALQTTQQVDQLKKGKDCLLFKYDFAVAQTNISPKASGNRCIVFLDSQKQVEIVLLVYGKTDLPKNMSETQFILQTVQAQFKDLWEKFD